MQHTENGGTRSACAACGYDLTGRRDALRCPECGGRAWLGELLPDDARMTRREARALGRESVYRQYRSGAACMAVGGIGYVILRFAPFGRFPDAASRDDLDQWVLIQSTSLVSIGAMLVVYLLARARLEHVATIRRLRAAEARLDAMEPRSSS